MKVFLRLKLGAIFSCTVLTVAIFTLVCCGQSKQTLAKSQNAETYFLYYLHGRIIEDLGADNAISEKFGRYEYKKILKTLEDKGFRVISEARPKNTDIQRYSTKLANSIKKRIENGVLPEKITIIGASKGSIIAMLISTKLANKNVKFVFMAGCNKWVEDNLKINFHGEILSVYEKSDTIATSCESIKGKSTGIKKYDEIQINTKLGHGFLYNPLNVWVDPSIAWAKQ